MTIIIVSVGAFLGLVWPGYLFLWLAQSKISNLTASLLSLDHETKIQVIHNLNVYVNTCIRRFGVDLLDPVTANTICPQLKFEFNKSVNNINPNAPDWTIAKTLRYSGKMWVYTLQSAQIKRLRPYVEQMWSSLYNNVEPIGSIKLIRPVFNDPFLFK